MRRERGRQVVGWTRLIAGLRNRQTVRVGRDARGAIVTSVERVWMGSQYHRLDWRKYGRTIWRSLQLH